MHMKRLKLRRHMQTLKSARLFLRVAVHGTIMWWMRNATGSPAHPHPSEEGSGPEMLFRDPGFLRVSQAIVKMLSVSLRHCKAKSEPISACEVWKKTRFSTLPSLMTQCLRVVMWVHESPELLYYGMLLDFFRDRILQGCPCNEGMWLQMQMSVFTQGSSAITDSCRAL